jgi:hypothetical protein
MAKKKRPSGRPVEFTDELQEQAWAYIDEYKTKHGHEFPSVVGLCAVINRGKSTIYDWAARDDNQFSDILAAIKERGELVLLNGSLRGDLNSNIAKLVLGKHGYHERQEVDVNDNRQHRTREEVRGRAFDLLGKGPKRSTKRTAKG